MIEHDGFMVTGYKEDGTIENIDAEAYRERQIQQMSDQVAAELDRRGVVVSITNPIPEPENPHAEIGFVTRPALQVDDTGAKEWVPIDHDMASKLPAEPGLTNEHFEAVEILRRDLDDLIGSAVREYQGGGESWSLKDMGLTVNANHLEFALDAYQQRTELYKRARSAEQRMGEQLARMGSRVAGVEMYAKTVSADLQKLNQLESADQAVTILQRIIAEQAADRARLENRLAELRMLAAEAADTPAHRSEMKMAKEKIRLLQETIRTSNDASRAVYVSNLEIAHKTVSEEVGALRKELETVRTQRVDGPYTAIVDQVRKERDEAREQVDALNSTLDEFIREQEAELESFSLERNAALAEVARLSNELEIANREIVALSASTTLIGQLSAWVEGLSHSIEAVQGALKKGEFTPTNNPPMQGGATAMGEAYLAAHRELDELHGQGDGCKTCGGEGFYHSLCSECGASYFEKATPDSTILHPDMFPGSDIGSQYDRPDHE